MCGGPLDEHQILEYLTDISSSITWTSDRQCMDIKCTWCADHLRTSYRRSLFIKKTSWMYIRRHIRCLVDVFLSEGHLMDIHLFHRTSLSHAPQQRVTHVLRVLRKIGLGPPRRCSWKEELPRSCFLQMGTPNMELIPWIYWRCMVCRFRAQRYSQGGILPTHRITTAIFGTRGMFEVNSRDWRFQTVTLSTSGLNEQTPFLWFLLQITAMISRILRCWLYQVAYVRPIAIAYLNYIPHWRIWPRWCEIMSHHSRRAWFRSEGVLSPCVDQIFPCPIPHPACMVSFEPDLAESSIVGAKLHFRG